MVTSVKRTGAAKPSLCWREGRTQRPLWTTGWQVLRYHSELPRYPAMPAWGAVERTRSPVPTQSPRSPAPSAAAPLLQPRRRAARCPEPWLLAWVPCVCQKGRTESLKAEDVPREGRSGRSLSCVTLRWSVGAAGTKPTNQRLQERSTARVPPGLASRPLQASPWPAGLAPPGPLQASPWPAGRLHALWPGTVVFSLVLTVSPRCVCL